MNGIKSLCDMTPGEHARICCICPDADNKHIKRRMLDLGMINDTEIECVGKSPGGDPKAFLIRGAVIALRSEDSSAVFIRTKS